MRFLEVEAIGRQLQTRWIAKDVSFAQQPLQNIAIAGETGSGKSTVLKIIAGLAQPHTGHVFFEGDRVEGPAEKLIPGHPGIAYLSQIFELPKFLRVEQVLQYASKIPADEARQLYEICRITHLLHRRTDELSGGEQQRTALARLLVMRPKLLLLDEPFSNLDLIHKNILKQVLENAQQQLRLSLILTSHDPQDTLTWADAIGVMKDGEIVQWGTPEQVYKQPKTEYVAGLFGKYNLLSDSVATALLPGSFYQKDARVLVRPEAFALHSDSKKAVWAIVAAVRFAGAYYELDIRIEQQLLTIQTSNALYKRGDRITVSLSADDVYMLTD